MKKTSALLLATVLCISLTACSGVKKEKVVNDKGEKITVTYVTKATPSKFEPFEKALKEKGYTFTSKDKDATIISGAVKSKMYILNDNRSIEIYQFDINSEAYKEAVIANKIHMSYGEKGVDLNTVFNDEYAIIPANDKELTGIFSSLE
ncbi:MAG: hypothetical protein Q8882_02440 [Bacillota bacterium]|nr:hypothetical protein [Bacillota bacterium]